MSLPESMPHKNGQSPASPTSGEAIIFSSQSANEPRLPEVAGRVSDMQSRSSSPHQTSHNRRKASASRTVFPTHPLSPSLRTILYNLTFTHLAGATLFRWMVIVLSAIFALILLAEPSYWIPLLAIWLSLVVALAFWRKQLQNEDFVRFEEESAPAFEGFSSPPAKLDPEQKIPVHVTGLFSVEEREGRFTWMPGFYRTFATREHALLCQHQDRKFLGLAKPDEETVGMWYIFFRPNDIIQLQWGNLSFGGSPALAIAVTRRVEGTVKKRFGREKVVHETIYMAFLDENDRKQVWADLHADGLSH